MAIRGIITLDKEHWDAMENAIRRDRNLTAQEIGRAINAAHIKDYYDYIGRLDNCLLAIQNARGS